jgi:peptidoglycan/LPS O-acetylase OafA/YrhL
MFAITTCLALPPILIGLAVLNTLRPALGFHRVPDRAFRPNISQLMAMMGMIGLVCFWDSRETIGYEKTKELWIAGLDVTFLLIALGVVVVRRRSVFGWLGRAFLISLPFALAILAVGLNGL